jgi:hypothetical protein
VTWWQRVIRLDRRDILDFMFVVFLARLVRADWGSWSDVAVSLAVLVVLASECIHRWLREGAIAAAWEAEEAERDAITRLVRRQPGQPHCRRCDRELRLNMVHGIALYTCPEHGEAWRSQPRTRR